MNEALLGDGRRAGLYRIAPPVAANLLATAASAGLDVVRLEIDPEAGKQAMLRDIGQALKLPAWFGENYDALYDCLTDPDIRGRRGLLLLFTDLPAGAPEFTPLTAVLAAAAESCRGTAAPLWILVVTDSPGLNAWPPS